MNRFLSRRSFLKSTGLFAHASWMYPSHQLQFLFNVRANSSRLSVKAHRTADFEGDLKNLKIRGQLPELSGSLHRIGPGRRELFGNQFKHFFDGDAYITSVSFDQGKVSAKAGFLKTQQTEAERASRKMLYTEFGTKVPGFARGMKYSPNVNIMSMGESTFVFSEGDLPQVIDPETFQSQGRYDFDNQWPNFSGFSAHPKQDPVTGHFIFYGITKSASPKLLVQEWNPNTKKMRKIASLSLGGYFSIHDMILTPQFCVFLVPPVKIKLTGAITSQTPVADLLVIEKENPYRIIIIDRLENKAPQVIQADIGGANFHHLGAWLEGQILTIDTICSSDYSVYELLKNWTAKQIPQSLLMRPLRIRIDLTQQKVLSQEIPIENASIDFPATENDEQGRPRFYYSLVSANSDDPLAFNGLLKWHVPSSQVMRVEAPLHSTWGEPVLVKDLNGEAWIFHLSYDQIQDETSLIVRNESDLSVKAQIHFGRYLPLGFHGNWVER